jgi:hypothetical protein
MVEASPSRDPGRPEGATLGPSVDLPAAAARLPEWRRGLPLLVVGVVFIVLAIWLLAVRSPLFAMRITLWPNLLVLGLIGIAGGIASSAVPWDPAEEGGQRAEAPAPGTVEVPRAQWEDLVRAFGRGARAETSVDDEPKNIATPEPTAELTIASRPGSLIAAGPGPAPPAQSRPVPEQKAPPPIKARPVRDYSRTELETEVDKIIGEVRGSSSVVPAKLATVAAGPFRCRACFTRFPAGAEQTPCASCHRPICAACLAKSVRDGRPGLCPSCARTAVPSGPSGGGSSSAADNV